MDDPEANQTPGENFNKIDLSALEAFQFGTQWTEAGDPKRGGGERGPGEQSRTGDSTSPRRDRRPPRRAHEHESGSGGHAPGSDASAAPRPPREWDRAGPRPGAGFPPPGGSGGARFERRPGLDRGPGGSGGGQRFDRGGGGGGRFERGGAEGRFDRGGPRRPSGPPRPYESPVFELTFYPDDHGFTALVKAMRASCRTYELFEIARLILGKPERCVVVFRRRAAAGASADAPRATLAVSVPTGLPFDTEDEAISYALDKGLDQFFTTESVEVEPPKGTYQFVNRCPVTKDLLGPPNYHRYEALVQQHYSTRGIHVPYERYKASIEVVRDPEAVNQWLDSMKKATRYTLKGEVPAGEQGVCDSLDEARAFLLRTARDRIVRTMDTVRVGAKIVEAATNTEAFRAMSGAVDVQRRFPLDTANALRGRLRRENFNIFKRGSKGVTYVCSVRRKFRQPGQSFSDSINSLIEFLDQNPMVAVADLAQKLLGFSAPAAPAAPPPAPPAAESSAGEATPGPGAEGSVPDPLDEPKPASAPEPEVTGPTPEQITAVNRLMFDLRWLVTEGYVAEYSDGRLFAHPVMTPQAQAQEEKGERGHESHGESAQPAPESVSEPHVETSESGAEAATSTEDPAAADPSPEQPPVDEHHPVEEQRQGGDQSGADTQPVSQEPTPVEEEPPAGEPPAGDLSPTEGQRRSESPESG